MVGIGRVLQAEPPLVPGQESVHFAHAPPQRDGPLAHGPRDVRGAAGHFGAVPPHARPPYPVAPRHRPRGDRHPNAGGARGGGGGWHPRRHGPRCVSGAGVGVQSRQRRADCGPNPSARGFRGLDPRKVYAGPQGENQIEGIAEGATCMNVASCSG